MSFVAALLVVFACQDVSWGLPRKNVLLLHNLNPDYPAIAQFDQGLLAVLRASDRFDVRVAAEYLNVTAFEALPSYLPETARYLEMKYTHWTPDAVFADRAVTGLYTQYLHGKLKDVPCFIAQDRGGEGSVPGSVFKTISWSTSTADIVKNLVLILTLRPKTRTVLVVLGASEEERRLAGEVAKAAAGLADRVTCVPTSGLSKAALLEQVAAVPADAAILYLRFALDGDGVVHVPAQVVKEITGRAVAPVFVVARHLLGDGVVGGYAASFELFGRRTALWILDALDGREPSGESLTTSVSDFVFDWRALKRFNISESALPPGSHILFHNATLWETYSVYILSGLAVLVAETFLVLGLVLNRLRRRRAEAALAALNATLETRVTQRTRELHEANDQLGEAKEELEALNRNLELLSRTDSLTGLPNRRHAEEMLQDALVRFSRYGQGFAVALADIDYFKQVNDRHGHEAGDALLRDVARVMTKGVRHCDLVARWGGEEFLLLLPGTDLDGAGQLLERIRERLETASLRCGPARASVTATIGAAVVRCGDGVEDVVRRADAAMYRGKERGRNRVVLEETDRPGGPDCPE
ncbi:diguanylate cyclase [Desulfovibrio aerotolerans]|uniref:diguanylate cyclase n=1 Tax=Solidesulfovibrio aerotolerans TaxID=295255 RepID=A0A7C9IUN4_9BACT|nr:GGDEF domain-containing protein [Solidesulfovibrio aerotolerans]MYL82843.1 diguanylate cyclase [Solidesulfovibrio aerotolerans]